MSQTSLSSMKSVLCLDKVYVEAFDFLRGEEYNNHNPKVGFGKEIHKLDDAHYRVALNCFIEWSNDTSLSVVVCGLFSFEEANEETINNLIYKNACAILFPYLRSQVTLLTSQPDFEPIVLPPININLFFEENNDSNKE